MLKNEKRFDYFYKMLLSERTRKSSESVIVFISISGYVLHLLLIALVDLKILKLTNASLLDNPIAAIYTPFSFILIYEVYLLIYYLPKSINKYIGKQYEIITLILIRRIYKDLSNIKFAPDWFEVKGNLQFTYDILGTIILFYLIFYFYNTV